MGGQLVELKFNIEKHLTKETKAHSTGHLHDIAESFWRLKIKEEQGRQQNTEHLSTF